MSFFRGVLITGVLAFAGNAAADFSDIPAGEYSLDKNHGYITFSYSHQGFSNPHVGFDSFDVRLNLDSAKVENSSVAVVIDATSVESRVKVFNGHLQGKDFFDTANHPSITFNSTSFKSTGEDTYDVAGELTIKGTTQSVTLQVTVNNAAIHPIGKIPGVGIDATTKVSRSAFGMSRGTPGVGDEVTLYVSTELLHKAP